MIRFLKCRASKVVLKPNLCKLLTIAFVKQTAKSDQSVSQYPTTIILLTGMKPNKVNRNTLQSNRKYHKTRCRTPVF